MANHHETLTAAVSPAVLLAFSEHRDLDALRRDAAAVCALRSARDWLMSEIAASRQRLSLDALGWLATEDEAKRTLDEHVDSQWLWWFTSILYRADLLPAMADLDAILGLADAEPRRFGADAALVQAARAWDRASGPVEFELPDAGGDGDDPTYVLCAILALRRLLDHAHTNGLCVVHLRYSFRVRD